MAEKRLLIFGGTFDPPHLAHTSLPPQVARARCCEQILYVPTALNPLKPDPQVTAAAHRLAMLRLALAGVPTAQINTLELKRSGPSFTIDTLQTLRGDLESEVHLHLLIGSDQALDFKRWRDWQRILELATPAVMVRPPLDMAAYRQRLAERYPPDDVARWCAWSVEVPQVDICATRLRADIAAGKDVVGLLKPAVLAYIREHGLYRGRSGGSTL